MIDGIFPKYACAADEIEGCGRECGGGLVKEGGGGGACEGDGAGNGILEVVELEPFGRKGRTGGVCVLVR